MSRTYSNFDTVIVPGDDIMEAAAG